LTTTIEERIDKQGSLNAAVRSALRVPIPQNKLLSRKGPGGTTLTYASTDYLEERLTAVDPDWQVLFTAPSPNVVICTLTLLGVQRSAVAGYVIPKEMTYWDAEARATKTRTTKPEDAHTIVTKAQAASFRRACAMEGLGAELWPDKTREDHEDTPAAQTSKPMQTKAPTYAVEDASARTRPKGQSNGKVAPEGRGSGTDEDLAKLAKGSGFATASQLKFLRDAFFVPPAVARELTSGVNGTTSLLIDYMKQKQTGNDDFEREAPGYLHEALLRGFTAKNRAGESVRVDPHQHLVKYVPMSRSEENETVPDEDDDED